MNRIRFFGAAIVPTLLVCGCSNLSHTENGALAGGAIGAGTGALIGKATGHTAGGAVVGGAIGALSGGLIGNAADQTERKVQAAQAQTQIGLNEVVQMTQAHVSDDVIINQIRSRGSVFQMSAQDTIWLKQNGVSDRVITEMQATANRYPRRVYTTTPVYAQPVYVVEPSPPPMVGVGLSYTNVRR